MYQHYRAMIPMSPGEPGDVEVPFSGKDGDEVVGILSNGIVLESHKQTWSYDSCNGHSDTKHMYHYHIPPRCFLKAMGVAYPEETFWWKNGNDVRAYDDMAAQWPATGPPSPVIGFALDGYPIFGPYDDAGTVQRGMEYEGSELDACNGKKDSNGNYGYYLTVDPPFAPTCLKGTKKGFFSYTATDKACPRVGIETTVMAVASDGACDSVDFSGIMACAEENPDAVSTPMAPAAAEEEETDAASSGSSNSLVGTATAAMAAGIAAALL
jgi:YHYH protein